MCGTVKAAKPMKTTFNRAGSTPMLADCWANTKRPTAHVSRENTTVVWVIRRFDTVDCKIERMDAKWRSEWTKQK